MTSKQTNGRSAVAASLRRNGVHVRIGEFEGIKLGASRFSLRDPYYAVLTISWPAFIAVAVSFYLLENLCFALAYYAVPDCILNARPGVFMDRFFFSIETLATVGYGVMSPASLYGHIVASTEIITGMMTMAVITGLVFVRFSRPRARLLFSRNVVTCPFEGNRALMVRVVNERHQAIADAAARMTLIRRQITPEGHVMRRFIDLQLERSEAPILGLSWTLIHFIDDRSPIQGMTPRTLADEGSMLMVSVRGYDESISSSVTARQSYAPDAVKFDHQFVNVIDELPTGEIVLDLTHFHDVVPLAEETLP
ncbi:MAG: ion channel [Nevskia sp.]|nr:ion channel [Nevskia sp.]